MAALRVAALLSLVAHYAAAAGFTTHMSEISRDTHGLTSAVLRVWGDARVVVAVGNLPAPTALCLGECATPLPLSAIFSWCLRRRRRRVNPCTASPPPGAAHRALFYLWYNKEGPYGDLLRRNLGSVYAGAPYPDYLYQCGPNHDDGELTHWPPFQAAAARYVRRAYPAPRNATGDAVVAFMFGVVSHYIADVNWHGMVQVPEGYGMIETTGGVDFGCTGGIGDSCMGQAHSLCDTGGEFAASYQSALTIFDDPDAWVIPVADLLAIYREANVTDVQASSIEECAYEFWIGAQAILDVSALIAPLELLSGPTFAERYIDHPLGGLDDMAVWTGRMWERWIVWLEQGPPPIPPPNAEADAAARALHHSVGRRAMRRLQSALTALLEAAPPSAGDVIAERRRGGGTALALSKRDASPHGTAARRTRLVRALLEALRAGDGVHGAAATDAAERLAVALLAVYAPEALPATGSAVPHALALMDRIAAPLHVATAARRRRNAAPTPTNATSVLAAQSSVRYAATSLAVGAFTSAGGARALLVGSPGLSLPSLPHAGGFNVIAYPPPASTAAAPASIDAVAPPVAGAPSIYARLGSVACVCDLNADGIDDAAVSAPTEGWAWDAAPLVPDFVYAGAVHVYFGGAGGLPSAPSLVITGENRSFFGGGALACGDVDGDGHADLVVGSPMAQIGADIIGVDAAAQRGRVDVFLASTTAWRAVGASVRAAAVANASYVGGPPYHWFGASLAVAPSVTLPGGGTGALLVIGGPGFRLGNVTAGAAVGRVTVLGWPRGSAPPAPFAAPVYTVTGIASLRASLANRASPKVGATVAVGRPLGGSAYYLAIGVPNTGNGTSTGAVLVLPLLPNGTSGGRDLPWPAAVAAARTLLLGSLPDARLGGGGLVFADVNGDEADELFAAAPMYTPDYVAAAGGVALDAIPADGGFGHELGCVLGFTGGVAFPAGTVAAAEGAAAWYAEGTSSRGRFGASAVAWDANGDGVAEAIAIGAPRGFEPAAAANATGTEMAGAVFVFSF